MSDIDALVLIVRLVVGCWLFVWALRIFWMGIYILRNGTESFDPYWHTRRGIAVKDGKWVETTTTPKWIIKE